METDEGNDKNKRTDRRSVWWQFQAILECKGRTGNTIKLYFSKTILYIKITNLHIPQKYARIACRQD